MMMKRVAPLLILILFSAACASTDIAPTSEPGLVSSPISESEMLPPVGVTAVIEEEPISDPTVDRATPAQPVEEAIPETFNGTYQRTYYRGSAQADLTIIDYSDFL